MNWTEGNLARHSRHHGRDNSQARERGNWARARLSRASQQPSSEFGRHIDEYAGHDEDCGSNARKRERHIDHYDGRDHKRQRPSGDKRDIEYDSELERKRQDLLAQPNWASITTKAPPVVDFNRNGRDRFRNSPAPSHGLRRQRRGRYSSWRETVHHEADEPYVQICTSTYSPSGLDRVVTPELVHPKPLRVGPAPDWARNSSPSGGKFEKSEQGDASPLTNPNGQPTKPANHGSSATPLQSDMATLASVDAPGSPSGVTIHELLVPVSAVHGCDSQGVNPIPQLMNGGPRASSPGASLENPILLEDPEDEEDGADRMGGSGESEWGSDIEEVERHDDGDGDFDSRPDPGLSSMTPDRLHDLACRGLLNPGSIGLATPSMLIPKAVGGRVETLVWVPLGVSPEVARAAGVQPPGAPSWPPPPPPMYPPPQPEPQWQHQWQAEPHPRWQPQPRAWAASPENWADFVLGSD